MLVVGTVDISAVPMMNIWQFLCRYIKKRSIVEKGTVFNIQRYTINDGPGIRTEIFVKGCMMKCKWCSNPESQRLAKEPGVYPVKCISEEKCGL